MTAFHAVLRLQLSELISVQLQCLHYFFHSVTIIIHSAATVKFTEKIKFVAQALRPSLPTAMYRLAVDLNVIGVRRMVELGLKVKNLKCFLHISTAYAHTNRSVLLSFTYPIRADIADFRDFIEERVYDPSIVPSTLVSLTTFVDIFTNRNEVI